MALPDVPDTYRLIHRQSFQGQEVLNVYYYRDVAITGYLPVNIASGWWNHVKAAWRAYQVVGDSFLNEEVEVEKLFDDHAFGIYPIPSGEQQGLRVGGGPEWMPPTLAAQIKLNVGTRATRPGSKRIAGLLESDVATLLLVTATFNLVQAFANVLDDAFTPTGGGSTVTPVVVGYPGIRNPGAPRVQDVVSAVASQYVSHQVSRDQRP